VANEKEKVEGIVNLTSTIVTDYAGGPSFKTAVPFLGRYTFIRVLPALDATGKIPRYVAED
jgi:hypothetical protein